MADIGTDIKKKTEFMGKWKRWEGRVRRLQKGTGGGCE